MTAVIDRPASTTRYAPRVLGAAIAALALAVVLRWLVIELLAGWNRWQFSMRPELENWTMPYAGTEVPSTILAIVTTIAVVAAALVVSLMRRRRKSV